MHLLLWAEDSESELRQELARVFPRASSEVVHDSLIRADFDFPAEGAAPQLVFARQCLPGARAVARDSIRAWAAALYEAVAGVLPDHQPWALHVEPRYGVRESRKMGARAFHTASRQGRVARAGSEKTGPAADAGRNRCRLIREEFLELLRQKRRGLLRSLRPAPAPFTPGDSLVQLVLVSPEEGYLSVALAPLPHLQRQLISPFPLGEIPVASDKSAPSRAFAKLVEASRRLGRSIQPGETCVDLGASPGSWTYTAVHCGASVVAVDRAPLREDLMQTRAVEFQAGDAFRFRPRAPVDWLLCDVIAPPERTAALLLDWLRNRWCRKFVVTLKIQDAAGGSVLETLKRELPPLTDELFLNRLCANKREACAFGSAGPAPGQGVTRAANAS